MFQNSLKVVLALLPLSFYACSSSDDTATTAATGATGSTGTTSCSTTGVDAGYGRIGASGGSVDLNATLEGTTGGCTSTTWSWTQTGGTSATLSSASAEDPTVTLPSVATSELLTFQLTAEDDNGNTYTDEVSVEVWVGADSSTDRTVLADFSSRDGWACDVDPVTDSSVIIADLGSESSYTVNEIPDHATGTFPNGGNPSTITAQSEIYYIQNSPTLNAISTDVAEFGITIDGVRLEPGTGETYQNAGVWRYEAITPALAEGTTALSEWDWLGTDCNNAHVQPNGSYHYHGLMESLINRWGETDTGPSDMVLGGYAADGFPFYLRYGYADPDDASSGLVVLEGSYDIISGTRPSGPGGAYDGTFLQDWEYVDGSGDLDECNGRFGVTPEYPGGIYHYYITDTYPYIPRCVFGTPDSSFRR